jgi:hypothetical protein
MGLAAVIHRTGRSINGPIYKSSCKCRPLMIVNHPNCKSPTGPDYLFATRGPRAAGPKKPMDPIVFP